MNSTEMSQYCNDKTLHSVWAWMLKGYREMQNEMVWKCNFHQSGIDFVLGHCLTFLKFFKLQVIVLEFTKTKPIKMIFVSKCARELFN